MKNFELETENIGLPEGATPRARCVKIRWRDRPIAHLTQGIFRSYMYPLYSPAGVSLTTEYPVDHPHHNSIVVSADVFFVKLPPLAPEMSPLTEEATYNLYVNNVFQGRAPGRIWVADTESEEISESHLRVTQSIEWQGPEEWGAPPAVPGPFGRRVLAMETRTYDIYPGKVANIVDLRTELSPTDWDITIGPTRHAFITVRAEDKLRPINGGRLVDSEGREGEDAIIGNVADWLDMSGPASYGKRAGIALMPHPSASGNPYGSGKDIPWYAGSYGTMLINPFQAEPGVINRGERVSLGVRILAHDGDAVEADVAGMYESFKREFEQPETAPVG